jgi:hypothetical protein
MSEVSSLRGVWVSPSDRMYPSPVDFINCSIAGLFVGSWRYSGVVISPLVLLRRIFRVFVRSGHSVSRCFPDR